LVLIYCIKVFILKLLPLYKLGKGNYDINSFNVFFYIKTPDREEFLKKNKGTIIQRKNIFFSKF
jgi:hypothetical protein